MKMTLTQLNSLARPALIKNFPPPRRQHDDRALLYQCLELVLVTVIALSLVSIAYRGLVGSGAWLIVPGILAAAALLPTALGKYKLTEIGLNFKQTGRSLRLVGITCLVTLPTTYIGLYLLQRVDLTAPLIPKVPPDQWLNWLLYQIMYVAAAEELFFRGYLQSSLLRLAPTANAKYSRIWPLTTVIISAAAFVLAHVILTNNALSVLTFFPGVVLGWLFLQTRSLLAPILFHALANIGYALMTAGLS